LTAPIPEEDFLRGNLPAGNKTTAIRPPDGSALLFSPEPRHGPLSKPFSLVCHGFKGGSSAGMEGSFEMKRVRSLLRSTPLRIGRRIALFVAIAAASLPDAGA
jgi:hypothetical protein